MTNAKKPKKKPQGGYVLARPPKSAIDKDPSEWTKTEEKEFDSFAEGFLKAIIEAPPAPPGIIAWHVSKRASSSRAYLRDLEALVAKIRLRAEGSSGKAKAAQEALPEAERHLARAREADRQAFEAWEESYRNQQDPRDVEWARSRNSKLHSVAAEHAQLVHEALEEVRQLASRMGVK